MSTGGNGIDLSFLEQGREERARLTRRRARTALGVSAAITLMWFVYVTTAGHWERVIDNWEAGLTMVFGSFVAGSTPQGGGAVAFPVFTKALEVPAEVARSFSLAIQTVGMGAASAAILLNRRRVEKKAVLFSLPFATAGFLGAVGLLTDGSTPFRESRIAAPYVKVSFTLVVGAMALITYLGSRVRIREVNVEAPSTNARTITALAFIAAVGGVAAALTGSGADVMIYLFLAILLAIDPKVGVPSSVLVMAWISVLGFVVLGLMDGQLAVDLNAAGDVVVGVGGSPIDDPRLYPADRFDLFGMWLAAAPVVAWGAPLGSLVASRIPTRRLLVFVIALAIAEIISTIIFVEELHDDLALIGYGIAASLVVGGGLWWISTHRRQIMKLGPIPSDRTLKRSDLDVAPGYREELEDGRE